MTEIINYKSLGTTHTYNANDPLFRALDPSNSDGKNTITAEEMVQVKRNLKKMDRREGFLHLGKKDGAITPNELQRFMNAAASKAADLLISLKLTYPDNNIEGKIIQEIIDETGLTLAASISNATAPDEQVDPKKEVGKAIIAKKMAARSDSVQDKYPAGFKGVETPSEF